MEIIQISESKLKLTLAREDLAEFDLDAEDLDYSKTDTKRMFWDILSRVKRNVGFETDGYRVLVQLFPSRDGGCEMFITKFADLCCHPNGGDTQEWTENEAPLLHYKPTHRSGGGKGKPGAF